MANISAIHNFNKNNVMDSFCLILFKNKVKSKEHFVIKIEVFEKCIKLYEIGYFPYLSMKSMFNFKLDIFNNTKTNIRNKT